MTFEEVVESFKEIYLCEGSSIRMFETKVGYIYSDSSFKAWCDLINKLHTNGDITKEQYEEWLLPASMA